MDIPNDMLLFLKSCVSQLVHNILNEVKYRQRLSLNQRLPSVLGAVMTSTRSAKVPLAQPRKIFICYELRRFFHPLVLLESWDSYDGCHWMGVKIVNC